MSSIGAVFAVMGLILGGPVDELVREAAAGTSKWTVRRPRCPGCGHSLTGRLRVPLVWAAGPRRCPGCGDPLGWRRWWLEAITGAACAALAVALGWSWELPAFEALAVMCVALAAVDAATHRLPNPMLMQAYGLFGGLLLLAAAAGGQWHDLLRASVGGLLACAIYLLLALAGGLGMGDVKLALVIGAALAWLGWDVWLVGLAAAPVLAALWATVASRGRPQVGATLAFAPFMATAALVGVLAGSQLLDWYAGVSPTG